MPGLFKKKPIKVPIEKEPIDYLVEGLRKKGIEIEIWDQKAITKNCGKSYLELFKGPLIETKFNRFLFIFREKEKRSAWYSEYSDRIVINFARSLHRDELQKAEKDARTI